MIPEERYRQGDVIQRVFQTPRGNDTITYYPFTTFSSIFRDDLKNSPLAQLFKEAFLGDHPNLEHSCSSYKNESMPKYKVVDCHNDNEEIRQLALDAPWRGMGRKQHDILQDYFFNHDEHTIAYEIPVYGKELNLSGHIDLIRLKDNKIQIVDFKPDKSRNPQKFANQLYNYLVLLKGQLEHLMKQTYRDDLFELIYFDDIETKKIEFIT